MKDGKLIKHGNCAKDYPDAIETDVDGETQIFYLGDLALIALMS